MKRNYQLVILCLTLATALFSCGKKDKVVIDLTPTPAPEITSFTPANGIPGTTVTVTGKNFSTNIPDNDLKLGTQRVVVKTATATALTFDVPFGSTTSKISVIIKNKTAVSANNFVVDPIPTGIAAFAPLEGPSGTEVTITGADFPLAPEVKLNGVKGEVKSSDANQIKFIVPYSTTLTRHKIVVTGGGKNYESTAEFTVTNTGKLGQWVRIPDPIPNSQNANLFPGGISFVFEGKLYWGFTEIAHDQDQFFFMYNPARPDSGWQATEINGKLPTSLQDAVPAIVGNKVYFGNSLAHENYGKWWEFDPMTKGFKPVAPIPGTHAAMGIAFTMGGKMYAASEDDDKSIYAYNPANNSWTKAINGFYSQINLGGVVVLNNEAIIGPAFKTTTDPYRKYMYKFTVNGNVGTVTELPVLPDAKLGILLKTPAFGLKGKAYFMVNERMWEYDGAATVPWRLVMSDDLNKSIEHVGVVGDKVYGWNNKGKIYEFSFIN
ncbi:IPT/TIG domain-containing protein [Chitinophaga sp.]|uniref:IPT/TIG domain-containing protein n=1 Tax=Chitinophaga sp. TaxID=1869181 RepID=UPI00261D2CD0|nr:IPT/TIG domain-containing protein [uncultured Chitinophaga sp.]